MNFFGQGTIQLTVHLSDRFCSQRRIWMKCAHDLIAFLQLPCFRPFSRWCVIEAAASVLRVELLAQLSLSMDVNKGGF